MQHRVLGADGGCKFFPVLLNCWLYAKLLPEDLSVIRCLKMLLSKEPKGRFPSEF